MASLSSVAPATKAIASNRLDPIRILAVDVGAGTQDILVYESDRPIENCVKLILPSQTQVVGRQIRKATAAGRPIYLTGSVMGGGASSSAVEDHLRAGLAVTASTEAARSLHNDLERVQQMGVDLSDTPPPGSEIIWMRDIDLAALGSLLEHFSVEIPSMFAIAAQDHGYLPGAGGREFRYEFLQSLLSDGGEIASMVYRDPPDYMIRMRAVVDELPGAMVMDTGSAAVLGVLGDPVVAEAADDEGAILVNIGNMHTFGVAIRGRRIFGLFEHHTGGITPTVLAHLVERLQSGTLTHVEVTANGGHGAAFDPAYRDAGRFPFVAITGPNRRLAASLGYHAAVPHGDMMLAGSFGLVEGMLQRLASEGFDIPVTTLVGASG
ncbi:MAG TPA: DUF1786 domain-containing protein [Thermomicrobiales bacterium]|nr:DUF1786 domain-containing protein [Thermomicrobiales bacterium]